MTKTLYIFLALLLVTCTLNNRQEEKLIRTLQDYIKAHNEDILLQYVAFTDAKVVKFYKDQGEDVFISHFKQKEDSTHTYYANYLMKGTEKQGKFIQRCFTVEKYTETKEINHEYRIYACSHDNGETWFMINEDDYFNMKIPITKRLSKK